MTWIKLPDSFYLSSEDIQNLSFWPDYPINQRVTWRYRSKQLDLC